MGKWTNAALRIKPILQKAAQHLDDSEALEVKGIYAEWEVGIPVKVHDKYLYNDVLFRCRQAHTTQADWTPDLTPAMWVVVDETHAGTIEDPIPAVAGMEYVEGLIYSEGDKLYRCIRGGIVYYLPSSLIGSYFEEVS
jgi:hypothetical protein